MRRIVVFNWLTADGYFAGPDGSLQLLPGGGSAETAEALNYFFCVKS
jgi:hypothetical protein